MVLSTVTLLRNHGAGLIERGVYGIVRHPMYLGAILLFFSGIFFIPHWIIALVVLVNAVVVYGFILEGDRQNIARFGENYKCYMEEVPRINLLKGLLRVVKSG